MHPEPRSLEAQNGSPRPPDFGMGEPGENVALEPGGMRNQLGTALILGVVAAAVGLALYGRAAERAVRKVEVRTAPAPSEPKAKQHAEARPVAAEEERTLPVSEAASDADGLLALRVTAGARPVPRAQVRLYRRDGRVPETGRVDWRVAAAGATGNDGRLLMSARPGAYLVAARAEGLAPAWKEVVHPLDGNRTPVHLRMEEPTAFSGRTVVQGTGQMLPRAELTLTPHVSVWEEETRADAPSEERVELKSDGAGRFQIRGLAPGLYTVEARAPEGSRGEAWNIRLPSTEPHVLALPAPRGKGPPPPPRREPSMELRCGT